ncbi:MAG: hypothetical protein J2P36_36420 [Ktedonobacteraceae bacterium]|nr:hypothetical protein [Ktedonobacteraceae bacterium]
MGNHETGPDAPEPRRDGEGDIQPPGVRQFAAEQPEAFGDSYGDRLLRHIAEGNNPVSEAAYKMYDAETQWRDWDAEKTRLESRIRSNEELISEDPEAKSHPIRLLFDVFGDDRTREDLKGELADLKRQLELHEDKREQLEQEKEKTHAAFIEAAAKYLVEEQNISDKVLAQLMAETVVFLIRRPE